MQSMKITLFCLFLGASACLKESKPKPGAASAPVEQPEVEPVPPVDKPGGTLENDEVEAIALGDAFGLQRADQLASIYLSCADYLNEGLDVEDCRKGVELGLNLLSNRPFIERVTPVKDHPEILRVDQRDFFGDSFQDERLAIEQALVLRIESKTARFRNLQVLTGAQFPILHAKVYLETAFLAPIYYDIKNIPLSENEFWIGQGVDRQRIFDQRDKNIFLANFEISQIAPGHNRHVRRMLGANGACYDTSDMDALAIVPESNLFAFPFPIEARSAKTFAHAAREVLCRQPNGLFLGVLFNGAGVRQNEAPPTVVTGYRAANKGLDSIVRLRDCEGCHTSFVIPYRDEAGAQIDDQPFNAQDKLLGRLFFKPETDLQKVIDQDNADHARALDTLGISQAGEPAMNSVIDRLRDGADAKELASFLYLSEQEFLKRLRGSAVAANEFGNLLNGGEVGFFTIQAGLQNLIDDLNLFIDEE